MANGSHKEGPARADRIREKYAARQRMLRATLASEPDRQLPTYDDSREEISTVKAPGVEARLHIPRVARAAIGFALAVLILAAALVLARQR